MQEQSKYKIEGRPSTIYRVVKSQDNPYVMIDRRPIDNPQLSFKAKGILTYLLSRPDGWEVSVADLIKRSTDGEAAVRAGLKELKDAGHMKYTQSRKEGRITGWLIEVFELPFSPDRDFQDVENQDVENRTQVLSTLSNKELKKPDILDGILAFSSITENLREAQNEFESALGFGALPWGGVFEAFGKWVLNIYSQDREAFRKYSAWRKSEGKYNAMSNKQIRLNPSVFMDTGYPDFLAHTKMSDRSEERKPKAL